MSADPDYGECYSCGCEGMAMTFREFTDLTSLQMEAVIPVFALGDGRVICGECYYKCRTTLLSAAEAMLAWEHEQMNPQPPGKGALDSLSAQMQNCEKYFQ